MLKIINKNNKIFLTLLYTFLIINIVIFSNYKTSNAKYIKKSETEFIYQNKLAQLYQESAGLKTTYSTLSTKNNLVFNLTFTNNEIAFYELTDIYEIILPNNCSKINNVNLSNEQTKKQFNYSVTCSIKDDSEDINIPITIKEKINDEDKFIYLTGNFKMSRQEFNSKFEDNQQKEYFVITKSDISNLYPKLLKWLETYYFGDYLNEFADTQDDIILIETAIKKYINVYQNASVDTSNDIINKDTNEKIELSGINIEYTPEKEEYKFTITNNFIGYARTYSQDKYEQLYFSTTTDLNNIFYEYLAKIYPTEPNLKETILRYLNTFNKEDDSSIGLIEGDITNYILQEESLVIPGLTFISSHQISVHNLLDYAKNFDKSPIFVKVGAKNNMYSQFIDRLNYYNNDISPATIEKIGSNVGLYYSITRNNNQSTLLVDYNDYHIFYDTENSNYLIINVFSNLDNEFTYADIKFISFPEFSNITFTNSDNLTDLTISLSLNIDETNTDESNRENIAKFITELSKYLDIEGTIKNSDDTYGTTNSSIISDNSTTSLTFTVTKNIPE